MATEPAPCPIKSKSSYLCPISGHCQQLLDAKRENLSWPNIEVIIDRLTTAVVEHSDILATTDSHPCILRSDDQRFNFVIKFPLRKSLETKIYDMNQKRNPIVEVTTGLDFSGMGYLNTP